MANKNKRIKKAKSENTANKAYKFRLYPNDEQKVLFAKTFGCVRKVYNYFLDRRIKQYEKDKTTMEYKMCSDELTELKKTEEHSYLNEPDSVALQQALRHLDTAFKNFFERPDVVGYPNFKSKKDSKNSYSTVVTNGNIAIVDGCLKLPKVGKVKMVQHRSIPSGYTLKSATISRNAAGNYYASLCFEYESHAEKIEPQNFLGLDYSMHELYKDSNGHEPEYPKYYRRAEGRLKKEQRKLSLMQKDSSNHEKQRIRVAKLHEKVANQRRDFLNKESRQIANVYDCVCIEDLNMQAMSQALNFGKSVHDNGWGMFTTMLKYKLEEQGKRLVKVDKFFASSQICSCCGYKNLVTKDLSVREWDCPECHTHHDRDTNAAINIKNEGTWIVHSCCKYVKRMAKTLVSRPWICSECGLHRGTTINMALAV